MLDVQNNNEIRSYSCPNCYLCGTSGNLLYQGLKDRLFGASGEWNLKKCPNPECGLVWLDPMPLEEEVGKAYQKYYTHQEINHIKRSLFESLLRKIFYLVAKDIPSNLLGLTAKEIELKSMYLANIKPGKLLDVGCGSGKFLNQMQLTGWEVEGVDFDITAVEALRIRYGINVHAGNLETAKYPDNYFDAITISHVIEHVHDPINLLTECYRILKSDGSLVVTTPNINSWGHQKFRANWRGLEPPRHIHLFSTKTLQECAIKSGFKQNKTMSTTAGTMPWLLASLNLEQNRNTYISIINNMFSIIKATLFYYYEYFKNIRQKTLGSNCILISIK